MSKEKVLFEAATKAAFGHHLSEWNEEISFSDLLLEMEENTDTNVTIWQPYEYRSPSEVASMIIEARDELIEWFNETTKLVAEA